MRYVPHVKEIIISLGRLDNSFMENGRARCSGQVFAGDDVDADALLGFENRDPVALRA